MKWFRKVLEASTWWYQYEWIVKLILDMSCFPVLEHPVQYVFNSTPEQLMQFNRLRKLIDIAVSKLTEIFLEWMNTKSVQNVDISSIQKLLANVLIS